MKNVIRILAFLLFSVTPIALNADFGTTTSIASAKLNVSITTKGSFPPNMKKAQRDQMPIVTGLILYNTTTIKPFGPGISEYFAKLKIFDETSPATLAIGDSYQGGIIAYILQPDDAGYITGQAHGIIAAATDQSAGALWGCSKTVITGADGTELGSGNQNTIDVMLGCATAGIAARICGDLVLNGFSDWYLPSKDELNMLYINRIAIGGFRSDFYWSSSEGNGGAWSQAFGYGGRAIGSPYEVSRVRAVRSF